MTVASHVILSSTRPVRPDLIELLNQLQPNDRIQIIQSVRVGMKKWQTTVTGAFRGVKYLVTGLSTDRVPEDDVVVPTVHFVKEPHGELSSIAIDEETQISRL